MRLKDSPKRPADITLKKSSPFIPSAKYIKMPFMDSQDKFKIEDIQVGKGPEVQSGDFVLMHYSGTLKDGTKFDSSYDRGTPFKTRIGVGQVIDGWDMGVPGMKVGGKRKLTIPAKLAYGDEGIGDIPGGATLIFEVELISIE